MAEAADPLVYYHGVLRLTWATQSGVENDADNLTCVTPSTHRSASTRCLACPLPTPAHAG